MSRIFLSPPDMSGRERELVTEAFDSNYVAPAGPMLQRFEEAVCDYTGFQHAVAVTTGTAALHLCMITADIGAHDTVWTSSATFIGGVSPISYVGAIPEFLDCDRQSWTIDIDVLAEALEAAAEENRLPKALVSTDLYGQSCDLDGIAGLCDRHGVLFISDSAEALGALYKGRHAGKGSQVAILSFNGNKIITTSGGGMVLCDDRALADRIRYFATQSRQPFIHYEHTELGYNYRLSNISAAIGLGQIEQIEHKVETRRKIFERYRDELCDCEGLAFMPEPDDRRSTHWLSCITVDPAVAGASSTEIMESCNEAEIEVRPLWKPMHLQPLYNGTRFHGSGFCQELFETGLCLPSGSGMSEDEQSRVIARIRSVLKR